DYLNSSILPIRKNYILLAKAGSLLRALHLLFEANGEIDIAEFREQTKLADITFSFVMRDMERLELITENEGHVKLHIGSFENLEEFNKSLQLHLQERLPNNRLISRLLKTLEVEDALTMEKMCNLLAEWSPYMSLSKSTWRGYARTFAKLMEAAHLATFNSRQQILIKYELNAEAQENSIPQARHHVGITVPWTYYSNVEEVTVKLYEAIQRGERVELTHVGLKANTFSKVLSTLEDLGFITRKHQTIVMLPRGNDFVQRPEKRSELLAEGALKIEAFAIFVDILKLHNARPAYSYLAKEIKESLGADWKDSTALVYVRIMLDWASHANLAPPHFNSVR
ncbi:MAG TPA: hypothetical protein VIX20_04750, partial [Ktedonobacteraceae bacterium]